jgi:3-oxoacyl-[acyl-carrier protein] reductase
VQKLAAEIRESVKLPGPALGETAMKDMHTKGIEQDHGSKSDSALRISIHQVDLASVEEIDNLFQEIKKEHEGRPIDILVSNAGYGKRIVDISSVPLLFSL